MRRMLICAVAVALCGLGGANLARAQEKIAPPAKTELKTEACHAPCLEKVCIAVPDKTKTSKTVYGCKEKDICLLRCPPFRLHRGGCEDNCGNCADCGRPRTVNVLLKKVVVTECDSTKCVVSYQEPKCAPVCAPACPAPCTTTSSIPATTAPVATVPAATTPGTTTTTAPAQPINVRPLAAPQGLTAPPTITIEGLR